MDHHHSMVRAWDYTKISLVLDQSSYGGFCLLVVEECKRMLVGAGFTELKERDTWKIEPGNKV